MPKERQYKIQQEEMDHRVTGRRKGKSILMESRRQGRLEKQSRIGWEQIGTDSK